MYPNIIHRLIKAILDIDLKKNKSETSKTDIKSDDGSSYIHDTNDDHLSLEIITEAVELLIRLLPSKETAEIFLVQELQKFLRLSYIEKEFATQSGLILTSEPNFYENHPVHPNSSEASNQFQEMSNILSDSIEQKLYFRVAVLDNLLKYFCLGKYQTLNNPELPKETTKKYFLSKESSYILALDSLNKKDYVNALPQLSFASKEGHAGAQFELGLLHYSGNGVKKDRNKALELFYKAHVNGNQKAETYIKLIKQAEQQISNLEQSKENLKKVQKVIDSTIDSSNITKSDKSSFSVTTQYGFIEFLKKLCFVRYHPRTLTWTDAFIFSDEKNSLLVLLRKNGIDFKYYADSPIKIIYDNSQRISTAGGSNIYRNDYSNDNAAIYTKIAELANNFVYNRTKFETYILQLQKNPWLSSALPYAGSQKHFEAIIFDIDNTLIYSDELSNFRGKKNLNNVSASYIENLRKSLKHIRLAFDEDAIIALKSIFPNLNFCVLTRSPQTYAKLILKEKYPNTKWDAILSYEDLDGKVKPSPHGINIIADKLNITDYKKIVLVGDGPTDVIASYQAGISSVVYTKCWEDRKTWENWQCIGFIPDSLISDEKELFQFISNPQRFRPMLESWCKEENSDFRNVRIINKFHSNQNLREKVTVLGRYFAKSVGKYNFSKSIIDHYLTEDIIHFKEGECRDYILSCCAKYLTDLQQSNDFRDKHIIVCPIPKKNNGRSHMEAFIKSLSHRFSNDRMYFFKTDLLQYMPGAQSHKKLNQEQRFENAKRYIRVANTSFSIKGKIVIIFDDVVTTGATFIYASHYLKKAGAQSVHCVALTQTISGV